MTRGITEANGELLRVNLLSLELASHRQRRQGNNFFKRFGKDDNLCKILPIDTASNKTYHNTYR